MLGEFHIKYGETSLHDVNTPRLQSLLAYLLLRRGISQSRAHLAYIFWPDTTEAQARTNLRNLLHQLRKVLPDADIYLGADAQSLTWREDAPFTVDVADFQAAISVADKASKLGDIRASRLEYEKATALYHGDLLPSCYDDWIIPQREGLRQAFLNALDELVRLLEDQRDYPAAIESAQRILRADPLHEATYRHLIRLHALNNDRASALRAYHTCASILKHELDVEPSAATKELYEQLLGEKITPRLLVPITRGYLPMVGRDAEWLQLLQAWKAAAQSAGQRLMLISGVAGIGKTRLVEELLQWANRQGITTANTRCYAAEGSLAYGPVIAWLRSHPLEILDDAWLSEISRLLPEVLIPRPDLRSPAPLTDAWQRQQLFEALARAVIGLRQPFLLIIDDLQWCDRDTFEWLHFLLRYDREARFLVVGTYRPEEITTEHPLTSLLYSLRKDEQVIELELQPLDMDATISLVRQAAGTEINVDQALKLFAETEGNPLFVVETVRAGMSAPQQMIRATSIGKPEQPTSPDGISLPPKVQSVLMTRLAQLSTPARELAGLAATIGREFSFPLLAEASNRGEDTLVRELDELWQRRIIREHGADGYDFSHDKLREVAYQNSSIARRRLLHQQVGRALETLHAADLGSFSHQIAAHYEQAGLPDLAAPFYLRSAQVARQVFANDEAVSLLKRGITLIEGIQQKEADHPSKLALQLWEELGDIHEMRAEHTEAKYTYAEALKNVAVPDRTDRARLHRKVGIALREERQYAEALSACNQAEAELGMQAEREQADWWREWTEVQVERIWAYYWLAHWPEMELLVDKTQPVVQELGGARLKARFLMAPCLLHLRRERYVVSAALLDDAVEAVAASREWGDLKTRIECRFELGFLHLWRRELDEAEENLQAALELIEISGFVPMRVLSLTYLTVVNRFRGKVDETSDLAIRAQIGAETAHMPDYIAAAKGNLAWVAWRKQDLDLARELCLDAVQVWQQSPMQYPFQWQALWTLIGVTSELGNWDEAWFYVSKLIEPTQQLLPEEINMSLEATIEAKTQGNEILARSHLECTITAARQRGYL
ncbi:MAG: 6-hydroxy-D-nicotine oxidase [Anaerolineae bacterium]|nr:6-hydroxy-D-nicotine oxidase [Anaerolineae bacterium]